MSKNQVSNATPNRTTASKQNGNQSPQTPEVVELLNKVAALLDSAHPQKALELLQRSKVRSPWVTNAMGVCLLRLGHTSRAVEVLNSIAVTSSVCFRMDVPPVFLTNFATALLMTHNVSGCLSALEAVRDEQNGSVARLRAAIRRWKEGLSVWQRIRWFWGDTPGGPVELGFPPGEI